MNNMRITRLGGGPGNRFGVLKFTLTDECKVGAWEIVWENKQTENGNAHGKLLFANWMSANGLVERLFAHTEKPAPVPAAGGVFARDAMPGQRFRTVPGGVIYSLVEVIYGRPGVEDWTADKNLENAALDYIFAIDDHHRLVAVRFLATVYLLNGGHP